MSNDKSREENVTVSSDVAMDITVKKFLKNHWTGRKLSPIEGRGAGSKDDLVILYMKSRGHWFRDDEIKIVASLNFSPVDTSIPQNAKWLILVYGEEFFKDIQIDASVLARTFNVPILHVRLESSLTRWAEFLDLRYL